MSLPKFLISYSIYTGVIAGIAFLLPTLFPGVKLLTDQFWLVFWFLCGLTLIAYILADFGIKRKPEMGVFAIMGSVILKMLFSMSFVLIYSLKHTESDLPFVFNFFSLYLLFTLFEILGLLRNLRHQNK